MKLPTAQQFKIVGASILVIIVVIVILQNTEAVETKLLFLSVSMPRAALLIITLLVGVVLGAVSASRIPFLKKAPKSEEKEKKE